MRLLRTRRHAPPYRALGLALRGLLAVMLACGPALAGNPPAFAGPGGFAAQDANGIVQGLYLPTPRLPPVGNLTPSTDLIRLLASATPTVCLVSDSTGTFGADHLVQTDLLWFRLTVALREAFPTKSFTFKNFAIGGTAWPQFLQTVTANLPAAWYTQTSWQWFPYVQAANCDTLFINWGINDGNAGLSGLSVRIAMANIAAWSAVPAWQASHVYAIGSVVLDSNGKLQYTHSGGTSGATAPTWATTANNGTIEGTVTWGTVSTSASLTTTGVNALATYQQKVPDIVLFTNKFGNPSLSAGAPFDTAVSQAGYVSAASWQRTWVRSANSLGIAGLPHIGLIDTARWFSEAVMGFDPGEQFFSPVYYAGNAPAPISVTSPTFLYPLPPTPGGDFDLSFTLNNGTAELGAAAAITVQMGQTDATSAPAAQSTLNIVPAANGNVAFAYYASNGLPSNAYNSSGSGATWGAGNNTIEIIAKQEHLYILLNGVSVVDALVPRFVGTFPPGISFPNAPAGTALTINSYNVGNVRQYAPLITPAQCWGVTGGTPDNGNGENHNASACVNLVDNRVIEAQRWAP
jgi:hypothetical protein